MWAWPRSGASGSRGCPSTCAAGATSPRSALASASAAAAAAAFGAFSHGVKPSRTLCRASAILAAASAAPSVATADGAPTCAFAAAPLGSSSGRSAPAGFASPLRLRAARPRPRPGPRHDARPGSTAAVALPLRRRPARPRGHAAAGCSTTTASNAGVDVAARVAALRQLAPNVVVWAPRSNGHAGPARPSSRAGATMPVRPWLEATKHRAVGTWRVRRSAGVAGLLWIAAWSAGAAWVAWSPRAARTPRPAWTTWVAWAAWAAGATWTAWAAWVAGAAWAARAARPATSRSAAAVNAPELGQQLQLGCARSVLRADGTAATLGLVHNAAPIATSPAVAARVRLRPRPLVADVSAPWPMGLAVLLGLLGTLRM